MYSVLISKSVEKEIEKIPRKYLTKIAIAIDALSANPRPVGSKKIKGTKRKPLAHPNWELSCYLSYRRYHKGGGY